MEVELKYKISTEKTAEDILNDPFVTDIMEKGTEEELKMEAVYFDTADRRLGQRNIALRTRREGSALVSTMKYGGGTVCGFSKREEINVPLSSEEELMKPALYMYKGTAGEEILKEAVGRRTLKPIIRTDFIRKKAFLNDGLNRYEISVDKGEITAGGKSSPIFELEIELYEGDEKALIIFGSILAEKYDLEEGTESKYKRGLDLLKR